MLCLCLSWDRHLHLTNIAGGGSHLVGNSPRLSHIRSCINPIVGLSWYRRTGASHHSPHHSHHFDAFWGIPILRHFRRQILRPDAGWTDVDPDRAWIESWLDHVDLPARCPWVDLRSLTHDFHITQCCPPKKMPELASLRQIDDLKRWSRCGSAPL